MSNNILLAGGRAKFEAHFSGNRELPFIFHRRLRLEGGRQGLLNLHRNVEILCITVGQGQVRCGEEWICVEPGDLVVVNSYNVHQTFPAQSLEYSCLIVDSDFCTDNGIDIDSRGRVSRPAGNICVLFVGDDAHIVPPVPPRVPLSLSLRRRLCRLWQSVPPAGEHSSPLHSHMLCVPCGGSLLLSFK